MNSEALKIISEWVGLFFKIGTPCGALIILLYCLNIGYFPQGITVGDSAYFLVVSIAYAFLFIIFTISLFSLAKMFAHVAYFFTKFINSKSIAKFNKLLSAICSSMTKDVTTIFSLFGLLVIYHYIEKDGVDAIYTVLTAFIIAFFVGLLVLNSNKQNTLKSRIESFKEVSGGEKKEEVEEKLSNLKKQYYMCCVAIFIWPIIFGGLSDEFINGAIRISKLRVNHASVYIDKKYCDIAKENYLDNHVDDSKEFCKFKDMVVLFHGIGVNSLLASTRNPHQFIPFNSKNIIIQPELTDQSHTPFEKHRPDG